MTTPARPVKLAIVGAGAHFTPGLLMGLVRHPTLADAEVALYDVDTEKLGIVERWGRRLVRDRTGRLEVRAVVDLAEALTGVDVAFTTIRVGGGSAARHDLEIPARHGVEQGVGDSVGPGGLSYALRQVPVFVNIARTLERVSPHARLVNFSNPMTVIGRALAATSRIPVVGLCDGIYGRQRWLANYLEKPVGELEVEHAGLNHMTWISAIRHGGQDLYPQLWQRYREGGPADQPISFQLLETYGLFPSPGDRHVAEFFPYFHRPEAGGGRQYGLQTAADRVASMKTRLGTYWEQFTAEADGRQLFAERSAREGQDALALVAQFTGRVPGAANTPAITVNVPNAAGLVPELPAQAVVEGVAQLDGSGDPGRWRPASPGAALPAGITAALRSRAEQQELVAQAAISGDRALALQAMAADPLIRSLEQASAILDDLLREQQAWLPQFN